MKRTRLIDRVMPDYTKGEEIFNMVTHIVGGALGIAATVLCVIMAALHNNPYGIATGAIFGATMTITYTMSSVYHGLNRELMAKRVFRVIDHCAVFLLIAGTYTPISLCALRAYSAPLGWTIFGVIWGCAALGITLNAIDLDSFRRFSMITYIGMGWCVVAAWQATCATLGVGGVTFLLLGGVFYTVGAAIYALMKKSRYSHSVFHLFTLLGSLMHFFMILFFIL